MKTLLIIVWLLCGIIVVWRVYFGELKFWYEQFEESIWDAYKRGEADHFGTLISLSPIYILGGLFALLLFENINVVKTTWYYKVPQIEE